MALRPPGPGQAIRAPYLAQEYRVIRGASSPTSVEPGLGRFRAPSTGIPSATEFGDKDVSYPALCKPMRWVGDGWQDDPALPEMNVFNSWPGLSVPGNARILAEWKGDHWEAITWWPC